MKVSRRILGLCEVAAKDDSRPLLAGVHFKDGKAVVTDGYRLLIVEQDTEDANKPVETLPESDLNNVTINKKDLMKALKFLTKKRHWRSNTFFSQVEVTKGQEGMVQLKTWDEDSITTIESKLPTGEYPNYMKIFPTTEVKAEFAVNIDLMIGLLAGIKKTGVDQVEIFAREPLDPVVITGKDYEQRKITAVIMPIRVQK